MRLSFRPVILDTSFDDQDAVLAFREERLFGVLSHLGAIHGESAGKWYVEVVFANVTEPPRTTFSTLEEFEHWVENDIEEL
jgi:hypothetical protein